MTFDYAGNLWVANFGSRAAPSAVTEYAPGLSGNVSPALTLTGGLTGLAQTVGVAFDPFARLYALNTGATGVGSVQASWTEPAATDSRSARSPAAASQERPRSPPGRTAT